MATTVSTGESMATTEHEVSSSADVQACEVADPEAAPQPLFAELLEKDLA